MVHPEVGVVVPTKDSARTLEACLVSLRKQTVDCRVVVVDNFSGDRTQEIARRYADELIVRGPERSAQRNAGCEFLSTPVVGFIDSDMVVSPTVVEEAARLISQGAVGAVVPEDSVGTGFWAAVRGYERSFHEGLQGVEAARFFDRAAFEKVGGFDEQLDAGEDWDLDIRVRGLGAVRRTEGRLEHDEGPITYLTACRKKGRYAGGLQGFHEKHGSGALHSALQRPYLRKPWILFRDHPVLGAGVVALKSGEVLAVAWAVARRRLTGSLVTGTGRRQ